LRSKITIPVSASKEDIETVALGNELVQNYVQGQSVKKVVVVPGRLVNIVI
jgi:leucyl-tRNA synthetase